MIDRLIKPECACLIVKQRLANIKGAFGADEFDFLWDFNGWVAEAFDPLEGVTIGSHNDFIGIKLAGNRQCTAGVTKPFTAKREIQAILDIREGATVFTNL